MTYGLHPSEVGDLRRLPNVTVVCKADAGVSPAIRRLKDLHDIIGTLSPETCVAYWDAGDVLFQTSLERLWHLVRQHAGKLLVVPEAIHGSRHLAVYNWTHTIYHKAERNRLYRLLRQNVYLNSGFAAGTAAAMSLYLSTAAKLSNSSTLKGTTDWGDQTAMNAYCHSYPERRAVISDDWNYTLVHRKVSDTVIDQHHVIHHADGHVIPVVHKTAQDARAVLARAPKYSSSDKVTSQTGNGADRGTCPASDGSGNSCELSSCQHGKEIHWMSKKEHDVIQRATKGPLCQYDVRQETPSQLIKLEGKEW